MDKSKSLFSKANSPKFQLKFHLVSMVFFILLTLPAATIWANSVPFLVAISMWALIAAHWAAYQGAHGEKSQDNDFAEINRRLDNIEKKL